MSAIQVRDPFLDGMSTARRPTGPILSLVVVALFLALIGPLVSAVPLILLLGKIPDGMHGLPDLLASTIVAFGASLIVLLVWVRWKEGRPISTLGFQSRPVWALPGALVGLGMFVATIGMGSLIGQLSFTRWEDGSFAHSGLIGVVLIALLGFVIQGSTEEIFCRGYLMQALNRKWGLPSAVAGQAIVFALMHSLNPGGWQLLPMVNLLLFAVFMAAWSLWEGGLWGVCLIHGVWNWAQGNVFGVLVSGQAVDPALLRIRPAQGSTDALAGGAFGMEGSVLTTLVLASGIWVLFTLYHRRKTAASPQSTEIPAELQ